MLAVGELSEAVEADRKSRRSATSVPPHVAADPDEFMPWFEDNVKDTVGDELADAYIRLKDAECAYGITPVDGVWRHRKDVDIENLADVLLDICEDVITLKKNVRAFMAGSSLASAKAGIGISRCYSKLESVAVTFGIDLVWHINNKLAYNELRPRLHGKKY